MVDIPRADHKNALVANNKLVDDANPLPVGLAKSAGAPVVTRGTVDDAGATIIAAAADRDFAEVQNLSADKIFEIGPVGFAYGAGHPVRPGETFSVRGSTAAFDAICNTGETANYSLIEWARS
jgi:hypothetical protein